MSNLEWQDLHSKALNIMKTYGINILHLCVILNINYLECYKIYLGESGNERPPKRGNLLTFLQKINDPDFITAVSKITQIEKDKYKIYEISKNLHHLYGMDIKEIRFVENKLVMDIDVNISVFNTKKYKYGATKNEELLEINRNTLKNIIKEHIKIYTDETFNFSIGEMTESEYF